MPTVSMPTVSMPHMPSIPGLRKAPADEAAAGEAATEQAVEAAPAQTEKDEDDRSR